VVLHRSRTGDPLPAIGVSLSGNMFQLAVDKGWLNDSPLTGAALADERQHWASLGMTLKIKVWRSAAGRL
jgi:exopolyphosphatase/guanosine-5'-triphosphate,3'-diphosphate pyrophosphatase